METLSVSLADRAGKGVEKVLVFLDAFSKGRPVWSTVLGLSDGQGRLEVSQVEEMYRADQERYPMDYKVAFEDFDQIEISVVGGDDFRDLAEGASSQIVEPKYQQWWGEARNGSITSTRAGRMGLQPVMHVDLILESGAHAA